MKRKFIFTIILFLLIAQSHKGSAQFTSEELSEREKWEEFLKTAEIVESEDIPEGVTKPIRLYLKNGEIEKSGAWKNPKGMQQGYLEGWQYEIAAYEMDKLLGLNMIPPTVERKLNEKRGSLQLWVEAQFSDLAMREQGIDIPNSELEHWSKMKYLARAFDCLIANDDRTQQNILYTEDWRTILIDHSRSFYSSKKYTRQLVYGRNGIKGTKLIRVLPRTFVKKIKILDFDKIKNAVGSYLEDKKIKAIVARKKLLLEEIEEMIKEKGEDKVLY